MAVPGSRLRAPSTQTHREAPVSTAYTPKRQTAPTRSRSLSPPRKTGAQPTLSPVCLSAHVRKTAAAGGGAARARMGADLHVRGREGGRAQRLLRLVEHQPRGDAQHEGGLVRRRRARGDAVACVRQAPQVARRPRARAWGDRAGRREGPACYTCTCASSSLGVASAEEHCRPPAARRFVRQSTARRRRQAGAPACTPRAAGARRRPSDGGCPRTGTGSPAPGTASQSRRGGS